MPKGLNPEKELNIEMIELQQNPIFEKGIFEQHPALFDPYFRNIPDHQRKKYQKARKSVSKYENKLQWQILNGPGFCGATHPGAGKVFHCGMIGAAHPGYNSDCLYVNPLHNIFAISDPPGATAFGRELITKLDKLVKSGPIENLEAMINEVNQTSGKGLRDRATLTMLHLPAPLSNKGIALLSGDSYFFHCNSIHKTISRLDAVPSRWGTPTASFKLVSVELSRGDFFILASDGITAVRPTNHDSKLDEVILDMAIKDPDNFVLNVINICNQISEEENAGQVRTVFGCGDDLSAIIIEPEKLQTPDSGESYILGGYLE